MRSLIVAGVSLLLVLAAMAGPGANSGSAQDRDPAYGVTIVGVGEVTAMPDVAMVRIGVVSHAASVRAALDDNNRSMQAVLDALRQDNIAERDMQTSQFNIQPQYRQRPDNQGPPRVEGYEVSNQVTVTVRDLDRLGAVLERAVGAGSNQILGIAFTLEDPQPLRDEARRLAVADAVRRALIYAEAAKIVLGPIRAISEPGEARPPQPVYQRMDMAAAGGVPIAEGEQSITLEVTITWDIRQVGTLR